MACNYQSKIVTNGLVLCLDAADKKSYPGSGTTWFDRSGNGKNGTLTNGPTFNSANGGAIVFDGVDDYTSSNAVLLNNADFSVSFWIKYQDTLLADRGLITTWSTSWQGFGIGTYATFGQIRSWASDGAGGGMNWGSLSAIQNKWTNLVLTYNFFNPNKTQRGYIDGVFKNSESYGNSITHSTLQISRGGQTSSSQLSLYPYTNSLISNISIYNRALSPQEITQNFNATRGRFGI
jgi:hypothetical protein